MLTEFLVKTFVKEHHRTKNPQVRTNIGILQGWVSIVLNVVLFVIKLTGGLVINSISLIADGIHGLSDVLSSGAVIYGFKLAALPPDKEHPYGHGRIENIISLIIAIFLIVTGLEFLKVAIIRIFNPVNIAFSPTIITLLLLTIGVNMWLSKFSMSLAKKINSKALESDAAQNKSDVYTSLIVLLPLLSEKLHIIQLDGIAGIFVSAFIIYSGIKIIKDVLSPLIGESATLNELITIRSLALSVPGVLGVHDIMMHKYGQVSIISLHAELAQNTTIVDGHEIIEAVEEKINMQMDATTIAHMDPLTEMTEELKKVDLRLREIINANDRLESYHDLRSVMIKDTPVLILDVVASVGTTSNEIKDLQKDITSALKLSFPKCKVKVFVEPKYQFTI